MESIEVIMKYLIDKGVDKNIVTMLNQKQILQKMLEKVNVAELAHDIQEENVYDIDKVLETYENEGFAIFSMDKNRHLVEYDNNVTIKEESVIGSIPGSLQDFIEDQNIYRMEEQVLDKDGNIIHSTESNRQGIAYKIKKKVDIPSQIDIIKNTMENISQNEVLNKYLKDNGLDNNLLNLPFFKEYFSHVDQYMIDNNGFERFDDGTKKQYKPIYEYDSKTGTLKSKGRGNSEIKIYKNDNEEYILEESKINKDKNVKYMMDFPFMDDNKNVRNTKSKFVYHINKDGIVQSRDVYSGVSYENDVEPKLNLIYKQELRDIVETKNDNENKKKITLKTIKGAVKNFFDKDKER